jgi:hypothetical protein
MDRERILRRALGTSAVFNAAGAMLFAFPAGVMGDLAGLPAAVPVVYRGLTALFVLLFGGAYAWLALQPTINRPFVAFGAIGKASAFFLVFCLWIAGEVPARGVAMISGDLAFAALFAWCLAGAPVAVRAERVAAARGG